MLAYKIRILFDLMYCLASADSLQHTRHNALDQRATLFVVVSLFLALLILTICTASSPLGLHDGTSHGY